MIIDKVKRGDIYIVDKEIKQNDKILTIGTPLVYVKPDYKNNNYIFRDCHGMEYVLKEGEFYNIPVSEIPSKNKIKFSKIKNFVLDNGQFFASTIAGIGFILWLIFTSIPSIENSIIVKGSSSALPIDLTSPVPIMLLFSTGFLFVFTLFILLNPQEISRAKDMLCLKENLEELSILLSSKDKILSSNSCSNDDRICLEISSSKKP